MRTDRYTDYADHIISSKATIKSIENKLLKNDFDTAQILAHQLKLQAMLLEQSIEKQIK